MCKQYEVSQMKNRDPNSKDESSRRGWIGGRKQ